MAAIFRCHEMEVLAVVRDIIRIALLAEHGVVLCVDEQGGDADVFEAGQAAAVPVIAFSPIEAVEWGGVVFIKIPEVFYLFQQFRLKSIWELLVFEMYFFGEAPQKSFVVDEIGRGNNAQRTRLQVDRDGDGDGAFNGWVSLPAPLAKVFQGHVSAQAETHHHYFTVISFQPLNDGVWVIGDAAVVHAFLPVHFSTAAPVVDHGNVPAVLEKYISRSFNILRRTVTFESMQQEGNSPMIPMFPMV